MLLGTVYAIWTGIGLAPLEQSFTLFGVYLSISSNAIIRLPLRRISALVWRIFHVWHEKLLAVLLFLSFYAKLARNFSVFLTIFKQL
ncbi:hypothetical protein SC1000_03945 [Aggregatibacter actinomycetemcomitans]|nr:hypothetical protein SC1000_03945 [Aggregatibacter actinomycetemcomitans]